MIARFASILAASFVAFASVAIAAAPAPAPDGGRLEPAPKELTDIGIDESVIFQNI